MFRDSQEHGKVHNREETQDWNVNAPKITVRDS